MTISTKLLHENALSELRWSLNSSSLNRSWDCRKGVIAITGPFLAHLENIRNMPHLILDKGRRNPTNNLFAEVSAKGGCRLTVVQTPKPLSTNQ